MNPPSGMKWKNIEYQSSRDQIENDHDRTHSNQLHLLKRCLGLKHWG
mgnify:CR=1 FL=1